jgi:hypothetical protein
MAEPQFRVFTRLGYVSSLIEGIIILATGLVTNYYAAGFATTHASSSVTDIVLSNIRVYDVGGIFTYGAALMVAFIFLLCVWRPQIAPFVLKAVGLFTLVRSFSVSLTHISPYPLHMTINSVFFSGAYFRGIFGGDDLFFSGHTGLPFLMALIFWDHTVLRYIFLLLSIMFGIVVLLGHVHYSIDVFSAYFITFGIYHLSIHFFKRDWLSFRRTPLDNRPDEYAGEKIV